MQFFHGTAKENLNSIKKSGITPSEFSINEYLTYIIKTSLELPQEYKVGEETIRTKWLGEGIYLFDIFNRAEAAEWRTRYGKPKLKIEDCEAIVVKVKNIEEEELFDLFSYSGRKKLKIVLDDKFTSYLSSREDMSEDQIIFLAGLQLKLIDSLDDLFNNKPYLGGVAIDLYNLLQENKISLVRGIYKKGSPDNYYDVYYCLKNSSLIDKVLIDL